MIYLELSATEEKNYIDKLYQSFTTGRDFELFLNYFCKIAVFPVSICGLVLTILKLVGVKEGKKFSRLLPENRFYAVISAVVWGSALAAAALLIAFSASFVFILTYFIVLFIVLGIICTIKLL